MSKNISKLLTLLSTFAFSFLLLSCDKMEKDSEKIEFSVDISDMEFTCEQQSYVIHFIAPDSWIASSTATWISLSQSNGPAGANILIVTLSENEGKSDRTGTVSITSKGMTQNFSIKQSGIETQDMIIGGKWYLGYYVSSSLVIHFNGEETITFKPDVLVWAGQQDPNGNGEYAIKYSEDGTSFTFRKSGSPEKTMYIVENTKDRIILREGEAGALRYWYTSAMAAINAPEPETNITDPSHKESTDIDFILTLRGGTTDSDNNPMGIHFLNGHVTTEEDRLWLANPNNEPDYRYANENPQAPTLTTWRHFSVTLYPFGDPVPADVNQHSIGDCSLCSVLASFAYIYPDYIKHIIKDNNDGTFSVSLYDTQGKAVSVSVNSNFLCDNSGSLAQVTGKNNLPTWSTVLEKALMKWETIYKVDNLWGIGSEFAAPLLTGDGRSFSFYPNCLWASELKMAVEWGVDNGMIGIGGFTVGGLQCGQLTSVTAHAFTLMYTANTSGEFLFSMRNPWGITSCDGVLDIPDNKTVTSTIDLRLIYPGAAAPYKKSNVRGYIPPKFTIRPDDLGVSKRLLELSGMTLISQER
ncbi:MAG: hypothetical protein KBT00_06000 [Bacteroidales bacterium]|nr:hypothetical protein [Candidatus Cacconaster merdequi]